MSTATERSPEAIGKPPKRIKSQSGDGSLIDTLIKGKPGYDSNAWAWEGGNAAKILIKINIFNIWGYATTIRDLMRYL